MYLARVASYSSVQNLVKSRHFFLVIFVCALCSMSAASSTSAMSALLSAVVDTFGSTTTNARSAFPLTNALPQIYVFGSSLKTSTGRGGGVEGEGGRDGVADVCGSRTTETITTTGYWSLPTTMNAMTTMTTTKKTKTNKNMRGTPSRASMHLVPPLTSEGFDSPSPEE